jgi:hypothetical protein
LSLRKTDFSIHHAEYQPSIAHRLPQMSSQRFHPCRQEHFEMTVTFARCSHTWATEIDALPSNIQPKVHVVLQGQG